MSTTLIDQVPDVSLIKDRLDELYQETVLLRDLLRVSEKRNEFQQEQDRGTKRTKCK